MGRGAGELGEAFSRGAGGAICGNGAGLGAGSDGKLGARKAGDAAGFSALPVVFAMRGAGVETEAAPETASRGACSGAIGRGGAVMILGTAWGV